MGISRSAVYYEPRPVSSFDLALMRRIDAVHLEMPWFGARGLRRVLKREYPGVGRRRIGTLMRHMGIAAVAPQPGTSRRHRAHPVYPYLLRHRAITRPKHRHHPDDIANCLAGDDHRVAHMVREQFTAQARALTRGIKTSVSVMPI